MRRLAPLLVLGGSMLLALALVGVALVGALGEPSAPDERDPALSAVHADHVARLGAAGSGDLQALLDAAAPGQTVGVPPGLYTGTFVIRTPMTLVGATGTVLDGAGAGSVLTIAAPDVDVSGLLVRGSSRYPVGAPSGILVRRGGHRAHVHDLHVEDSYMGITVQRAADVVIERVHVVGSGSISGELHAVEIEHGEGSADDTGSPRLRGDGVWVFDGERTVVRDNVIETVRDGVQLTYGSGAVVRDNLIVDSRYAVHDMYAADATFAGNDLRGNLSGIVVMYGGPVLVQGNTITENGSPSTGYGVLVKDAAGVTIASNVVADNRVAVHVDDAGRTGSEPTRLLDNTLALNQIGLLLFPSTDAIVTGNGFVENSTQVALGGTGRTQVVWTVDGVGNHWSDYQGFDADGDGTGDVAYARGGRVSRSIAEDPMLLAIASGPAFRVLAAVEDRWVPSEPVVRDEAPQTTLRSPALDLDREGSPVTLWLPGVLVLVGCSWLLLRGRRARGVRARG